MVGDAIPTFVKVSSPGALTGAPGGDEVLDLGQVPVDSYDKTVSIAIANEAVGDADSLAGLLTFAGSGVTLPLASFSGVAPSGASGDYDFTIALTLFGELWDVVTLMPVDQHLSRAGCSAGS